MAEPATQQNNTKQNIRCERRAPSIQISLKQWCQIIVTMWIFLIICYSLQIGYEKTKLVKLQFKKVVRKTRPATKIIRDGYRIYFKDGKDHMDDPLGSPFVEFMAVKVGFTEEYFSLIANTWKLKNRTEVQEKIYKEWISKPEYKAALKESQEIEFKRTLGLNRFKRESLNKKSYTNNPQDKEPINSDLDKIIMDLIVKLNETVLLDNSTEKELPDFIKPMNKNGIRKTTPFYPRNWFDERIMKHEEVKTITNTTISSKIKINTSKNDKKSVNIIINDSNMKKQHVKKVEDNSESIDRSFLNFDNWSWDGFVNSTKKFAKDIANADSNTKEIIIFTFLIIACGIINCMLCNILCNKLSGY